jgi:uncharacterized phage-like protein YoqJ
MILAFTGHRPEKLPWGNDESDPRCAALKQQILDAVRQAAGEGYDTFLCGMARGCDTYFAEAVLSLGLRLEAYLPCPSQADRWSEADRALQTALLLQCGAVYMVEPEYTPGCMLRRNQRMVDACDALLTVYDGSPGGTGATIDYACRRGKSVTGLWL